MANDEKAVQNAKGECGHGEEIHGRNGLAMISKERQPAFRGGVWSRRSPQPA